MTKTYLVLFSTLLSAVSHAVDREGRVAVVVVDLATHAPAEKKYFYDFVEAAALAETNNRIKPIYRKVIVLTGAQASSKNFYAALKTEVENAETKAIDAYINLHGSNGALSFFEGLVTLKDVRSAIASVKGATGKLRALNSTACYGASHSGDWVAAGFKVASGARKINTNGAYDFPTFLKSWGAGETYSQAQDKGNELRWINFYDAMAIKWGVTDTDSYKVVEGKSDYTISTPPTL